MKKLDRIQEFLKDEKAEAARIATEMTQVALVVALVLVPIGLVTLANTNTTGMAASQVAIVGSLGVLILVSVLLAILRRAMGKGK
jgi:hypothetical protein